MASCYREATAYRRDMRDVQTTQTRLLLNMVRRQRETWFGKTHRFVAIQSVRDFQHAVPVSDYDDYRSAIERIGDGERNILTSDQVRVLEPTGGSTAGEKLIPYTDALRASFQRAIRVWIWDLYSRRPAVRRGRSYWSITPLAQPGRRTRAGIPIGFEDDTSYLGRIERALVARTMAVPAEIVRCPSAAAAQYATLFHLLRADDLRLISVWSPTFLSELLRLLWLHREQLCDDVESGKISFNTDADPSASFVNQYQPLSARAESLRRVFQTSGTIEQCVGAIWPALALVSCWTDGPSSLYANCLRNQLPGIGIQGKGLLSTEAFVTIPLLHTPAPALAIRSHFFEFQPAEDIEYESSPLQLAHELEQGCRYRVVVTNGGGLYRYRLHDEVAVVGFSGQVPLLRFVGKTDDVCDVVGEKLSAAHVEAAMRHAFEALNSAPAFAQLRAVHGQQPHYRLSIVAAGAGSQEFQDRLAQCVEDGLNANPAYRYARELGQLHPLAVEVLNPQEAELEVADQIADLVANGKRLGTIKPRILLKPRS